MSQPSLNKDFLVIPLTKGKFAWVDIEDANLIRGKWCLHSAGYACRRDKSDGSIELMHRLIMNPPVGLYVDHINSDKLDNRRSNLRIVTNAENIARAIPKSGLKGVSWHSQMKKWRARIFVNGHESSLGLFDDKAEAIEIWNKKAKEVWGEYAWQNPIH